MSGKKVLVFSPTATHPIDRGSRKRIVQVAKVFRDEGYEIHLAVGRGVRISTESMTFWDSVSRLRTQTKRRRFSSDVPLDSWYSPSLGAEIFELVHRLGVDILLWNYIFHSKALEFVPEKVTKIIDTHDVFGRRNWRLRGIASKTSFFSCSTKDEEHYLNRADIVLALSPHDLETFEKYQISAPVILLPYFEEPTNGQVIELPKRRKFVFGWLASNNAVNVASLLAVVDAIHERYQNDPPFELHVSGSRIRLWALLRFPMRAKIRLLPWLKFKGFYPDISDFYKEIDAVIVGDIGGTGVATKFAEGLSKGQAVLSTRIGSRGYNSVEPLHNFESIVELLDALQDLAHDDIVRLRQSSRSLQGEFATAFEESTSQLFAAIKRVSVN